MIQRLGPWLLVLALLGSFSTARAADIVGRGSLGGSVGIMKFVSGDPWSDGNARPILQAHFKYNFTGHLAGIVESGWGWNNYDTPERAEKDTLATVVPTTLGLEYRWQWGESKAWPHVAAGGGFYVLGVKDGPRGWAYAKSGTEKLLWASPGVYGKVGMEYLFDDGVAINFDFLYHRIFSEDEERFPDLWGNTSTSFGQLRLGVNYYFTLKSSGPAPPGGK